MSPALQLLSGIELAESGWPIVESVPDCGELERDVHSAAITKFGRAAVDIRHGLVVEVHNYNGQPDLKRQIDLPANVLVQMLRGFTNQKHERLRLVPPSRSFPLT
jgi:hypothetical protein